jgi:hypothetical protein
MEQFYLIVLAIAVVVLIGMLTFIGVLLYTSKSTIPFPPLKNPCPDYWQIMQDSTDGSVRCKQSGTASSKNVRQSNDFSPGIYTSTRDATAQSNTAAVINPNAPEWARLYANKSADCAKAKWANNLGIVWDGYTNSTGC